MKRLLTYMLAGGLLIAAAVIIYFYQEYMREDTNPDVENQYNPIINKRLNAVVLRTSTVRVGDQPKFEVAYRDIDTKETASFLANDQYQASIHIGDTLTKDKGEKLLFIYQKEGKIETVPID